MSDSNKFHIGDTVTRIAEKKAENRAQALGQVLPCYVEEVVKPGLIVTVKFDVETDVFTLPPVTMPIIGSEYMRIPVRKGDKGIAIAADTHIGNVSGLGGKARAGVNPSNLGALVFMPVGDNRWEELGGDSVWLYSVFTGARVRVAPDFVDVTIGETMFRVDSTGVHIAPKLFVNGDIEATGDIKAGDISLKYHLTSGVQPGGGKSNIPVVA